MEARSSDFVDLTVHWQFTERSDVEVLYCVETVNNIRADWQSPDANDSRTFYLASPCGTTTGSQTSPVAGCTVVTHTTALTARQPNYRVDLRQFLSKPSDMIEYNT